MARRIAWTRLWAWFLAVALMAHGLGAVTGPAIMKEASIAMQWAAAVLLLRRSSQSIGLTIGLAVLSVCTLQAVLAAEFNRMIVPGALVLALLMLAKQIDRNRHEPRRFQ
ncbi:hypothetical protein [Sphingomonas morindae]|uniref:Uncharacterized protein n=1 Tax=Sphingomonas morindae TaxID=1541170 RepID=A0ABY4XE99_9SPHN|nr:hypothetical protein [Sphingomonas morindae]USI75179.1 hypothetical protein LHA26_19265 [Sphingomonas morindae]